MDDSKEYIKMVHALDHEFWELFQSDFITPSGCNSCFCFLKDTRLACCKHMERRPMPRQDQLQEMISNNAEHLSYIFINKGSGEFCYCKSMEQLWLAFVMKEKYNKTWNGSDWVKSTNN